MASFEEFFEWALEFNTERKFIERFTDFRTKFLKFFRQSKPTKLPSTPIYLKIVPEQLTCEIINSPIAQIELWEKFGPFFRFYMGKMGCPPSEELIKHAIQKFPPVQLYFLECSADDASERNFRLVEKQPELRTIFANFLNVHYRLNLSEFDEILNRTNGCVSGSSIYHCLLRGSKTAPEPTWLPHDIDIYLNYEQHDYIEIKDRKLISCQEWHTYLTNNKYIYAHSQFNYRKNNNFAQIVFATITYFMPSTIDSPVKHVQLIFLHPRGVTPRSTTSQESHPVSQPSTAPFFIEHTFDLSFLQNYYHREQFYTLTHKKSIYRGYLGMWFAIARFQVEHAKTLSRKYKEYLRRVNMRITMEKSHKRGRFWKYDVRARDLGVLRKFNKIADGVSLVPL